MPCRSGVRGDHVFGVPLFGWLPSILPSCSGACDMPNSVSCPHCHTAVHSDPQLAGQVVVCPNCNGQFQMPGSVPQAIPAFPSPPNQSFPVFDSGSRSKTNRKQQSQTTNMLPVLVIGGAIGLSCIACLCAGIAGSTGGSSAPGFSSSGDKVDPGEFKDSPESFQGRTVVMDLQYWPNESIRDLRQIHQEMKRSSYDIEGFRISKGAGVTLTVPTDITVPALESGNSMIVTFRCTKGSTDEGNVVTHIRRPNKYGN